MKDFNSRCYKLLSKLPKNKVTTYKAIAQALGTKAYRAVGNAMNKNPYPPNLVPCHRVVNTNGNLGGFAHDIQEKIKRLKHDGISVREQSIVDFKSKLYLFSSSDQEEFQNS